MKRPLLCALLILAACSDAAPPAPEQPAQPETFDFVAANPEETSSEGVHGTRKCRQGWRLRRSAGGVRLRRIGIEPFKKAVYGTPENKDVA